MESTFWLKRWQDQKIGFHLGSTHPLLNKFYSQVYLSGQGIFVPLCGKTQDLVFLASKSHQVVGCELSEQAAIDFFSENQLDANISSSNFQSFSAGNIEILQGDFFELEKKHIQSCQAIYDRAALIALPQLMRQAYVKHMSDLFEQAKLMLITLEYPQAEFDGPPFSVSEDEVMQLYDFAKVEKIYAKSILEKEPRFIEKGLSQLIESVYCIQW